MISENLQIRLDNAQRDLKIAESDRNFQNIRSDSTSMAVFSEARSLAVKWLERAKPVLLKLDDESLQPLAVFIESLVRVAAGQVTGANDAITNQIRRMMSDFRLSAPALIYEILDRSGIAGLSDENFPQKRDAALQEIDVARTAASTEFQNAALIANNDFKAAVEDARGNIRKTVEDAEKDLERIKTQASRISVESAQKQFIDAARTLRFKAKIWTSITVLLFLGLFSLLGWLLLNPPMLIRQIVDALKPGSSAVALPISIPLLVVASAYFTSVRLAIIAILSVGLAFSLRMSRAYLHMIEHNEHKLRVTNSIEAFVAAVRTNDQKDMVLSKLVESVTEFGDSGILSNQGEAPGLPSVIFESMTKNIGKSE